MNSTPPINWGRISEALTYYRRLGYRYIEVPWTVSEEALRVTLPKDRKGIWTQDGALVGSAEQSFIELMLKGGLQPGRYVAATPCFRDEPVVDEQHQRTFFKVELIEMSTAPIREAGKRARDMADEALVFFASQTQAKEARVVKTLEGFDVEVNHIEVGSYGYRNYLGFHWIYGTGLAEPRFSVASRDLVY